MKLIIFTDGASRGNPGLSSYGFVIYKGGKKIYEQGQFIGVATNNIAEYTAVLKALEHINQHPPDTQTIEFFMDSRLVAEQLTGRFKVKNPKLKLLFEKIKILEFNLGRVFYTHIPRSKNTEADRLANQAIDSR